MQLIGRLVAVGFALLLALPVGALLLGLGALVDPVLRDVVGQLGLAAIESVLAELAAGYPPDPGMVEAVLDAGRAVLLLVAVPPILNAVMGEVLGWRALTWYAGATGFLTALLPWLMRGVRGGAGGPAGLAEGRVTALLFLAGAGAGLVYWLLAGRRAGGAAAPRR
ncbi:conserved hypothetical protein [Methylobacterium sp. 4-46]|uniref:hypothetical protein n=1 Tax=unclassified Methylobacterium TaxID=2615210 RepID=UPI000165CDF3|nr:MULTISPECIES: hypothetical protein [Methylobacterium]ACA18896.1 conserved hypothetical protein [Methylobacterium sp. 4-46]WFT78119.1 hypothetical protein QA634_22855 [Methylobacterium nodulans]